MKNRKILFYASMSLVVLGFLHFIALRFHLYWTLSGFDLLQHFIGGVSVAFFGIFIYLKIIRQNKLNYKKVLLLSLFLPLLVGIFWELFESKVRFGFNFNETVINSYFDIISAILGGFFSYLYFKNKQK